MDVPRGVAGTVDFDCLLGVQSAHRDVHRLFDVGGPEARRDDAPAQGLDRLRTGIGQLPLGPAGEDQDFEVERLAARRIALFGEAVELAGDDG